MENSKNNIIQSRLVLIFIVVICGLLTYWTLTKINFNFKETDVSAASIDVNEKDYHALTSISERYSTKAHPEGVGRPNPFENY
ncbi:MAG: hypothetical protein WCO23_03220 [bacterium]